MLQNHPLTIARTIADVRMLVAQMRARGLSVGLVPTMGALHAGHLALIARAQAENDRVIATIFVNPLQFGPAEDFATYPRDDERDIALLRDQQCNAVFLPSVSEMFADGVATLDRTPTRVSVPRLAELLCGRSRPGHFDGVATIVLKLLLIALPDTAYFGEKDYQQLTIVKQLVRDLCVPVRVVGVPIVREADGVALSSRNRYLDPAQRARAPELLGALRRVRAGILGGADPAMETAAASQALRASGFDHVDYITLADAVSLETLPLPVAGARIFAAAWLGRTRLIDNISLGI